MVAEAAPLFERRIESGRISPGSREQGDGLTKTVYNLKWMQKLEPQ